MKRFRLIEISGDFCAGCHALIPELNAVAAEQDIDYVRIDAESEPQAAEKYRPVRLPTVILSDGEREIARCTGYQPQEILALWVEAKIEDYMRGKI